jgi:hypothetical protein
MAKVFQNTRGTDQDSGIANWVCRPCQSFGQRVQHQFAENNKRHDITEKRVDNITRRMDDAERNMEKMKEDMKKMADKMSKDNGDRDDKICDEMQEREVRRMNLIIHGIDEQPEEVRGNRERIEKDKARCEMIFKAMRARTKREDIRFCRRIEERGNEPQPVVIGLENEEEKRHILSRARDLRGTQYCDVSIVPDLTRQQHNREAKMKEEVNEKNKTLTTEERERNIKWMVVGRRGEKRIIKGVERDQQNYRHQGEFEPTREQQRARISPARTATQIHNIQPQPGRAATPPRRVATPPRRTATPPRRTATPPPRYSNLLPDNRDRSSRWEPQARDERELGARSKNKNDRWQENRTAGGPDRRENSSRWEERRPDQRGATNMNSKRTRASGGTSEEDDQPASQRTRQKN